LKACFLMVLLLLAPQFTLAQLPYTQAQVIAYAKSIDVQTLDPSLPSRRLKTGCGLGRRRWRYCIGELQTLAISNQMSRVLTILYV
jgi:hypothetical protein